jgi:uncharacterized protein (TIGR00730 family)
MIRNVCIYCGAQDAVPEKYKEVAAEFGAELARRDVGLVYGGGDCGLMGASANGALKAGGRVIGVFPAELRSLEVEHKGLTEIIHVHSMHERKMQMFRRSDAFVAFPGGFGTMDETFEMITWHQLGMHQKPIVIFNHEGYWDHWVQLTERMLELGFARPETRDCYKVANRFEEIFTILGV